jgi:hypothetical protein
VLRDKYRAASGNAKLREILDASGCIPHLT